LFEALVPADKTAVLAIQAADGGNPAGNISLLTSPAWCYRFKSDEFCDGMPLQFGFIPGVS
jgi:hypothetical protein